MIVKDASFAIMIAAVMQLNMEKKTKWTLTRMATAQYVGSNFPLFYPKVFR